MRKTFAYMPHDQTHKCGYVSYRKPLTLHVNSFCGLACSAACLICERSWGCLHWVRRSARPCSYSAACNLCRSWRQQGSAPDLWAFWEKSTLFPRSVPRTPEGQAASAVTFGRLLAGEQGPLPLLLLAPYSLPVGKSLGGPLVLCFSCLGSVESMRRVCRQHAEAHQAVRRVRVRLWG